MKDDSFEALEQLTPRERHVLMALMRGATAREISKEAFVSLPTVRSQIRSILAKLGVSSQLGAVVLAYRNGWPQPAGGSDARSAGGADRLAVGM
ncbi:MAG: response regulator transcription factor [Acidimicrobiales bacterium]